MTHHSHAHGIVSVWKKAFSRPPVPNKNPVIAALLGLFLGAIGVGIYLGPKEGGISFLLTIGMTIVIPGLGFFLAFLANAFYAYNRAGGE